MEILSPVGGKEQLIAAVRSGANAVYLGLKDLNARRNADNFENESLEDIISYCHARNVKVYITLNTLIKDSELGLASESIRRAAQAGADALIIQDLGMYRLAKEIAPFIPLHASTQMSIHNVSGVEMLETLGFSRVVPARELSLRELNNIRKNCNIELEVFVHGALCMCISGQCYLSSVLGQRSANRGLCAQPCRLDFKAGEKDHALSLKDLSVIKDLKELERIGINSAKIEGRMKRPEYVAAATDACVKANSNMDFDTETLQAIFSRSGFTDGYIHGKLGRDMFGYRTKEDVTSAAPVLKKIANSYRNEMPLVPVNMKIEVKNGKPVKLTVYEGETSVTVSGAIPEKAINKSVDSELLKRSLEKCGGTPYFLNELICDTDDGLSLSASVINGIRKEALENLEKKKGKAKQNIISDYQYKTGTSPKSSAVQYQKLFVRYENVVQISDRCDKIILDYEKIHENQSLCLQYRDKLVAELPALMFDERGCCEKLSQLKKLGIREIYAPNLYAVNIAKKAGFDIIGGYGLNILNSPALEEYRKIGIGSAEISFETTVDAFRKMSKSIPCGLIVYGKMPLMTFRNCPAKPLSGCGSCNYKATILDRYNNEFTVLCKDRKYGRLLNPQPIYMGDKKDLLKTADFLTVYFTDEKPQECIKVLNRIKSGSEFDMPYTRGLYFKEVL